MEKTRLRIRFTKSGDLRWISHRDLARVWERLLRRANLQLAFSEGFHPKPRINFPSALALGVEALDEIVELEVVGSMPIDEIETSILQQLPEGMKLLSLHSPEYKLGKARVESTSYRIAIPTEKRERLHARINEVLAEEEIKLQRDEKKTITCDVTHEHFALALEDDYLNIQLPTIDGASIRPSELLSYLELDDLLASGAVLQRTAVDLREPESPAPGAGQPQNNAPHHVSDA